MAAKQYAVNITFTNAPSAMAEYSLRETASSPAVAVKRAIDKALWQLRRKTKHRGLFDVGRVSWALVKVETKPATSSFCLHLQKRDECPLCNTRPQQGEQPSGQA